MGCVCFLIQSFMQMILVKITVLDLKGSLKTNLVNTEDFFSVYFFSILNIVEVDSQAFLTCTSWKHILSTTELG